MKFSIKDLVTFAEEILNGKLHFLYSEFREHQCTFLPFHNATFPYFAIHVINCSKQKYQSFTKPCR